MQYVGQDIHDEFTSGYLQGEYEASNDWTLIARTDNSFDEETSPYLQLLPAFISQRHMLGVRWDFLAFQSFTVELARTSTLGDEGGKSDFNEGRIQWSAVFP